MDSSPITKMISSLCLEPKVLPLPPDLKGMSEKTMTIHHDKLYAGYVTKKMRLENYKRSRMVAMFLALIKPTPNYGPSKMAKYLP